MRINKHIAQIAANINQAQDAELLQYIWNNRETSNFFNVNVVSVARSGASRKMTISINYKNQTKDITKVVGLILGDRVKHGELFVSGGGMDMIFETLYSLYYLISTKRSSKGVCKFKAVNHYGY